MSTMLYISFNPRKLRDHEEMGQCISVSKTPMSGVKYNLITIGGQMTEVYQSGYNPNAHSYDVEYYSVSILRDRSLYFALYGEGRISSASEVIFLFDDVVNVIKWFGCVILQDHNGEHDCITCEAELKTDPTLNLTETKCVRRTLNNVSDTGCGWFQHSYAEDAHLEYVKCIQ